jgi:hypothetical protein
MEYEITIPRSTQFLKISEDWLIAVIFLDSSFLNRLIWIFLVVKDQNESSDIQTSSEGGNFYFLMSKTILGEK